MAGFTAALAAVREMDAALHRHPHRARLVRSLLHVEALPSLELARLAAGHMMRLAEDSDAGLRAFERAVLTGSPAAELDRETLCRMHGMLLSEGGRLRQVPVWLHREGPEKAVYIPPPPDLV